MFIFSGGGGGYTTVPTFDDLPTPASAYSGRIYIVATATGIPWLPGYKVNGMYRSDGANWVYIGNNGIAAGSNGDIQVNSSGVLSGQSTITVAQGGNALSGALTTNSSTGTQNNLALTTTNFHFTGGTTTITGLAAPATAAPVRVTFYNAHATNNITIPSQSASSTAANRFSLPYTLTIRPGQSVIFQYNNTLSRWVVAGNALSQPYATASVDGILSSSAYSTFNNKMGGSAAANYVAIGNGSNSLTYNGNLVFNSNTARFGVQKSVGSLAASIHAASTTGETFGTPSPNGNPTSYDEPDDASSPTAIYTQVSLVVPPPTSASISQNVYSGNSNWSEDDSGRNINARIYSYYDYYNEETFQNERIYSDGFASATFIEGQGGDFESYGIDFSFSGAGGAVSGYKILLEFGDGNGFYEGYDIGNNTFGWVSGYNDTTVTPSEDVSNYFPGDGSTRNYTIYGYLTGPNGRAVYSPGVAYDVTFPNDSQYYYVSHSWNNGSYSTGYKIVSTEGSKGYLSATGFYEYATTFNTDTTATPTGIDYTGLSDDYYYTVFAYGTINGTTVYSPSSSEVSWSTTGGEESFSISWGAVSGATGYKILRGTETSVYTQSYTTISTSMADCLETAWGGDMTVTPNSYLAPAIIAEGSATGPLAVVRTTTNNQNTVMEFQNDDASVYGTITGMYNSGNEGLQIGKTGEYLGFVGATPVARPDYTLNTYSTDRNLSSSPTTTELRDVLGSLIADLIAYGLLK